MSTSRLDDFLVSHDALHVAADGQMQAASKLPPARVLLSGSFNPLHRGHWELAQVAQDIRGAPVTFELSVVNVDKPALTATEIRRRLAQFNWQASVWLTHAPRFVQKAELFPGCTFVVGADTALRLVLPRYYDDDEIKMVSALNRLRELRCRFLVACRVDAQGQCIGKSALPIPISFAELFEQIPATRFRWDISSTALRQATPR